MSSSVTFHPHVNEEDIFATNKTHLGKLQDPMFCGTVNENNEIFVPNRKLIDSLLAEISTIRNSSKILTMLMNKKY